MSEMKTARNARSVDEFLAGVADPKRRADATAACALMREVTGTEPVMWGTSIVGFGMYHYRYASGREGEAPAVGLSPRKQNLTLYLSAGFDSYRELLGRLGRHSTGKACLYVRQLSDIDQDVLRSLIRRAFEHLNGRTLAPQ